MAAAQYQSIVTTITAVQWTGDNVSDITDMMGSTAPLAWQNYIYKQLGIVTTNQGMITLNDTEWLIYDAGGNYRKLSNTAFTSSYIPV
jgi:hypothetical protein